MSRNYSVTEPHPSVPKAGAYMGGGRGGAGNFKRYQASELTSGPSATGPPSRITLTSQPQRVVRCGRGGAGNFVKTPETEETQRIFQFDEEMVKRREIQAPVYHIGRGGAANFIDETKPRTSRLGSTGSTGSVSSSSSVGSVRSALGRLTRKISNHP